MKTLPFHIAVEYKFSEKTTLQYLTEKVDGCFYLGGKKAEVISGYRKENREGTIIVEKKQSMIKTVLKIALILSTFPVLLTAKIILRNSRKFYILENKTTKKIDKTAKKIGLIQLPSGETSEERGEKYGEQFRSQIQATYKDFFNQHEDSLHISKTTIDNYIKRIPEQYVQEMKGLAKGAQLPFKKVVALHHYVDKCCAVFACSIVAQKAGKRVLATNKFFHQGASREQRYKTLKNNRLSNVDDGKKLLGNEHVQDKMAKTVQSIIFDQERTLHMAVDERSAAHSKWSQYSFKEIFGVEESFLEAPLTLRNLDWSDSLITKHSLLQVHNAGSEGHKFVSASFPGYLGVITGMNEKGIVLGCCVAGSQGGSKNPEGIPNTFLYRKILEESASTKKALEKMNESTPGYSMNVGITGPKGMAIAEIDPQRSKKGIAKTITEYV